MESSERSPIPVGLRVFGFLVPLLLAAPAGAASLPSYCDPDLVGEGELAYRLRDGERCEGQYATKVSGSNLVVASVEGPGSGTPAFQDGRVGVRVEAASGEGALQLRVRALKPRTFYFMDAVFGDQPIYYWPTSILEQMGLQGPDLGAVVLKELDDGTDVYLPVAFLTADESRAEHVRVVIVPQRVAAQMYVSVVVLDSGGKPTGEKLRELRELGRRYYPAGQPVEVPLPELTGRQGRFRVEIAARLQGGGTATQDFQLLMP